MCWVYRGRFNQGRFMMNTQPNSKDDIDVLITEVVMRDGLQSVPSIMPTAAKFKWIDALVAAGVREIEVTSFVPARLMPQLADAAQVVQYAVNTYPNLSVISLVPNLRGAEAAIAAGTHKITVPTSASIAHSLANVRKTREDMIEEVRRIVQYKNEVAPHVQIEAGVSVAFGCTLQGAVPEDDVIWMVESCINAGADVSGMADTTGMANPAQVKRLFTRAIAAVGLARIAAAHMHNTRGLGIANCLAAYDVGIRGFDTSMGGLGGCPHAPGASGNVVTEDLVFMFEAMGVKTGIDLNKLLAARQPMMDGLPNEPVYGMLAPAGLPKGFVQAL
jgi:hydroxymethylglutaryl-CoA lyase